MIEVSKTYFGLNVSYKYLSDKIDLCDIFKIVCYNHSLVKNRVFGFLHKKELTGYNDLTISENDILNGFKRKRRKRIKDAIEKDNIICSENISISQFVTTYNSFAIGKHINKITDMDIQKYGENIKLFKACYDDKIIAIISVLLDKSSSFAISMQSGNCRYDSDVNSTIIGNATSLLRYYSFLYCKKMGIKIYDCGGLATEEEIRKNPNLELVNEYKLSYGTKITHNYVYKSIPFVLFNNMALLFGIVKSNSSMRKK